MIFFKKTNQKITILGSGSFGTALAVTFAEKNQVFLWGNDPAQIEDIQENRENSAFLPGVTVPDSVEVTLDIETALKNADMVVFAVPSQAMREVALTSKPFIRSKMMLINVAKGLEESTGLRMSKVLGQVFPLNAIAVLSGPSHAEELGRGIPTTVVAAATKEKYAKRIQETLVTPKFRIYTSKDIIGVELGGVLKNIIAIAAGINDGLGYGDNSRAALITRGLVEISRFGKKMGAKFETFLGLSGIGDLVVTATSSLSRNYTFGKKIGQGKKYEEAVAEMRMVCEGIKAALVVHDLSRKKHVEMPIAREVYKVLFEKKDPRLAVRDLMTRSIKSEKMY